MLVAFLIDSLGQGGAERSLAELAPALAARGHEVHILVFRPAPEGFDAEVRAAGIPLEVLEGRSRLARALAVRRWVRAHHPDVLWTCLFESDLAGRLGAVGSGTAVVSTVTQTSTAEPDPGVARWKHRLAGRLDGLTARHLTRRVHAVSDAAAADTVRRLGVRPNRVVVVHRGRDAIRLGQRSEARRREVRAGLGVGEGAPLVVAAARQEPAKGLDILVAAAARLRARRPDLQVVVAGREGRATTGLRKQVQDSDLSASVHLIGVRDDVPDLLAAADVVVIPSRREGLPGVALEAMGLGVAMVAADLDTVREAVGDEAAQLVPSGDAEAMASALDRLLGDAEERQRMGTAGRARYERRFSLAASVDGTLDLLGQAVSAER